MVMEGLIIQMETFKEGFTGMVKGTEKVNIRLPMEIIMKVNLKMINILV